MAKEEIRVVSANSNSKAVQEIIERERKKKAETEKAESSAAEPVNNVVSETENVAISESDVSAISEPDDKNKQIDKNFPTSPVEENKKKNGTATTKWIIVGIIGLLLLGAIYVFTQVIPRRQAVQAYNSFIDSADTLLDEGKYFEVSENADEVINEHVDFLKDDERSDIKSRTSFAKALDIIDLTDKAPSEPIDSEEVKGYLEAADGYSMTEEFLTFVESNSMYCDSLTGTLVVDHSQFKVPEQGDSNEDNDANAGNVSFLYNNNNDYSFIGTVVTSKGAARPGGEAVTSDDEEEEEMPVINEYDCSGYITIGLRKKDKSKGLSTGNVEKIIIAHVSLDQTPTEEGICTTFDTEFKDNQTQVTVIGTKDNNATEEYSGTFTSGTLTVKLDDGVTLEVMPESLAPEPETTYSSGNSSSGTSGSSSGGSYYKKYNNDKDYEEGSDWEKYDSDSDGKINDKEFQDATNDYMDDYYDDIGDGGNNLDAYDYNNDGEMGTDEFQDAVGDYMDSHGY